VEAGQCSPKRSEQRCGVEEGDDEKVRSLRNYRFASTLMSGAAISFSSAVTSVRSKALAEAAINRSEGSLWARVRMEVSRATSLVSGASCNRSEERRVGKECRSR